MAGVASLEEDNEQLNVECSTGVCEVRGSYLFVITEECGRKLWAGFKMGSQFSRIFRLGMVFE